MGVVGELKKAARKMLAAACASSSSTSTNSSLSISTSWDSCPTSNQLQQSTTTIDTKNVCTICLEALTYSRGQAIFTAQCSHSFHFACIVSNVRHGNLTCPICRAHWTQLPRNRHQPDPVFQILDHSIATSRLHRRNARYNDDDHVGPPLQFSLAPLPPPPPFFQLAPPPTYSYLCIKSSNHTPLDLVLVASPTGPHLRLVKQSMALVVSSLRPLDRLAIVTSSSSAARVFPLRRMTQRGKQTALRAIERLFFMGQADPADALKKGVKILEDRAHSNPRSCILHLSDSLTSSYRTVSARMPVLIHRFGLGASSGFVMHEFEEFLDRVLGGVIRDVQLRIGEGRVIRIGELRGGDEKRILLDLGDRDSVCVKYSYTESGVEECNTTGETLVSLEDKVDAQYAGMEREVDGVSSVESWDYHDPCMA